MGRPWQAPWQGAAAGAGAGAVVACGASRVRAWNLAADLRQRGRAFGAYPWAGLMAQILALYHACGANHWCKSTAACGSHVWVWARAPALQCVVALSGSCAETLACRGLSESRAFKKQHWSALISRVVPQSRSSPCCHMHQPVHSMPRTGRSTCCSSLGGPMSGTAIATCVPAHAPCSG